MVREVGPAEIRFVVPDRVEPFELMTRVVAAALVVDRSDNEFGLIFRNRVDLFAAFSAEIVAKPGALVANNEASSAAVDLVEAVLGGQFRGRSLRGVVPYELDRSAPVVGGEFKFGRGARWEGVEIVP